MFKPWMAVKVVNENSGFFGQAGTVVRIEKHDDKHSLVHVEMDADNTVQSFVGSEIEALA